MNCHIVLVKYGLTVVMESEPKVHEIARVLHQKNNVYVSLNKECITIIINMMKI